MMENFAFVPVLRESFSDFYRPLNTKTNVSSYVDKPISIPDFVLAISIISIKNDVN